MSRTGAFARSLPWLSPATIGAPSKRTTPLVEHDRRPPERHRRPAGDRRGWRDEERMPIASALTSARLRADDGEHAVEIVRLDPALQELGRDAELGDAVGDAIELEASEPGREDFLAEFRAQAPADAVPRHRLSSSPSGPRLSTPGLATSSRSIAIVYVSRDRGRVLPCASERAIIS